MADTDRLIAPELIFVETPSALHRLVRGEVIEDRRAEEAVHDLRATPVRTVHHRARVALAWAGRQSLRVADSYYVACARVTGHPLLTTDARLARASTTGVTVILVR